MSKEMSMPIIIIIHIWARAFHAQYSLWDSEETSPSLEFPGLAGSSLPGIVVRRWIPPSKPPGSSYDTTDYIKAIRIRKVLLHLDLWISLDLYLSISIFIHKFLSSHIIWVLVTFSWENILSSVFSRHSDTRVWGKVCSLLFDSSNALMFNQKQVLMKNASFVNIMHSIS